MTFLATGTAKIRAWVYALADANAFLRDPHRTIYPIPGGFCNYTFNCNITLTNLSTTMTYGILYQPNNTQSGTDEFVAYSLLPSKL